MLQCIIPFFALELPADLHGTKGPFCQAILSQISKQSQGVKCVVMQELCVM